MLREISLAASLTFLGFPWLQAQSTPPPIFDTVRVIEKLPGMGRVSQMSVDNSGFIWLLDASNSEVLGLNVEGELAYVLGGEGLGSRFFPIPIWMGVSDTLISVLDGPSRRISDFDRNGDLLGTRRTGALPDRGIGIPLGTMTSGLSLWKTATVRNLGATDDDPMFQILAVSDAGEVDSLAAFRSGGILYHPATDVPRSRWGIKPGFFGEGGSAALINDFEMVVVDGGSGAVKVFVSDSVHGLQEKTGHQLKASGAQVTAVQVDSLKAFLLQTYPELPHPLSLQSPEYWSVAHEIQLVDNDRILIRDITPQTSFFSPVPETWVELNIRSGRQRRLTFPPGFGLKEVSDLQYFGMDQQGAILVLRERTGTDDS